MATVINGHESDPATVRGVIASSFDVNDWDDPLRLYTRSTALNATYTDVVHELMNVRAAAVAAVAEASSYERAAKLLGLSKGRVQQLVNRHRAATGVEEAAG